MNIAAGFVSVVVLSVIAGAIVLWPKVIAEWRRGIEPVPHEPRRIVPWHALDIVFVVVGYILIQQSMQRLFQPQADDLAALLLAVTVGNLLIATLALLALPLRGANWDDLGLSTHELPRDAMIGVLAFVAIAPVVFAIQAVLRLWFAGDHPVVELLQELRDPLTLVQVFLGVVVVAPLVEELLFRVLLQGWLERLFCEPHIFSAATSETPAFGEQLFDEPARCATRSWPAIVLSSTLFALMHWREESADPVPLFFLSLVLGYLYQQTHRIWPSVALHATLNGLSLLAVLAADKPPL